MMIIQFLLGLVLASIIEWTVHKHILHELGKKKVSIFSFHWGLHHAQARRNGFYDPKISGREIVGVLTLCLLGLPIWYVFPFVYYALLTHSALYFVIHNLSHKYPEFAKRCIPWHYDHHMGKNQNTNWCVVHPLADYLFKTRSKNEY